MFYSVIIYKLVVIVNLFIFGRGDFKLSLLFCRDLLEDLFYYFFLIVFK